MAEISKITLPNSSEYDIKDAALATYPYARVLDTRTYTGVIGTANDQNGAGFFYMKLRRNAFDDPWYTKVRVRATVPGQAWYETDTIFELWGRSGTYLKYCCTNWIKNGSYRPIYYNSAFWASSTGFINGCGDWLGVSLYYSTNPTSTSYKRTIVVDLLEYSGCTYEFQDTLITPTNIPDRAAHTAWYASTNTSYLNLDACSQGIKQTGDVNTTTIHSLYVASGNYVADSAIYRYQLLFQTDEDRLTPLNNNNNVTGTTKTMLTDVEFDPFGRIFWWGTTNTQAANAAVGAGSLYYAYSGVDLRYSFNCGTTLTAHKPFYLVVTPQSDGKVKIASATPWAQALPTTNDGKYYILLGRTYSTYQMTLYPYHPVYRHDGTKVVRVLPPTITATTTENGLMSASDKAKLNGIAAGATANTGTITKVQANGTDVASSGTANIPAASTSAYGVTKLSSATDSTSTALAATPSAVKAAYDLAASKTSNTGTVTSITLKAGSGITLDTDNTAITTSGTRTIGHANSITAKTTQAVYPVKIDAQGHISAVGNAVTIGAAAAKAVDTSIIDGSTSTNLPTSRAVATFVEGKGYVTHDTTYSASTTSIGSASTGTAIAADDITAWNPGTLPTVSVENDTLVFTVGSLPSISYTAKSIPNISVTSKTVVTGISAS